MNNEVSTTLADHLEPYRQRIEKSGVEFIWATGEILIEARAEVVRVTGDGRAPGFTAWCKEELNISTATATRYINAAVNKEEDVGVIWGNKKSIALTQPISLPDDKYSVIYADPPWKYTSGDQHTDTTQETVIGSHYQSMTISELCDLPVVDLATDNAVLFLWVTSPLLDESFSIIDAWGFEYKTSIVWDKVKHNVGNYVSVRHEFLLICTRGSFTPTMEALKLEDSVQVIERTKHSEKPEEFRSIIETLYPGEKYIELFARKQAPGWDSWGDEI